MSDPTIIERAVTINHDQELYVIQADEGWHSCLGFDVVKDRIERYCLELIMRGKLSSDYMEGVDVVRGSRGAYDTMMNLRDMLRTEVEESGERAVCELSPQLCDLEGHRVEVVDRHGVTRRFIVGKSTGWLPCHLEIKRRTYHGGLPADREYQSVTDLGPVR